MKKSILLITATLALGLMASCAHHGHGKGCCKGKDSCPMEASKGKDCGCGEHGDKAEKAAAPAASPSQK